MGRKSREAGAKAEPERSTRGENGAPEEKTEKEKRSRSGRPAGARARTEKARATSAAKTRARTEEAREEERDVSSYYRLNTQAIEDLVGATIENSPKVSEKELRKYRSGPQIHLGDWMKAALIKWWFHGAVCFFFFWGLGMMVPSGENLMLILGMAMGFVTDLMVNSIFRYYAKTPGANDRWMMFGKKGFASLPKNIVYGYVILACVIGTYSGINGIAAAATGNRESVALGVEPILFGLFATGWDFLFLGIRSVVKRAIAEAERAERGKRSEAGRSK